MLHFLSLPLAPLLILGMLVTAVSASQSATPATAGSCLDDGYLDWTRDDEAKTTFTDAAECIAYVEAGGALLPARSVSVTLLPFLGGSNLCTVDVELRGFNPGTYEAVNTSLGYAWRPFEVTVTSEGMGHYRIPYPFVPGSDSIEAVVDGVSSGSVPMECDG
jgi:hypothetical protein